MSSPLAQRPVPLLRPAAALVLAFLAAAASAQSEPADVRPSPEKVDENFLARRWAQSELAAMTAALRRYAQENSGFPAGDVAKALEPKYLAPAPKADPWGTPYAFDLDARTPKVTSAGPDRTLGTADDLALGVHEAPPLSEAREVRPRAAEPAGDAPPRELKLPDVPAEQSATFSRMQQLADGLEAHRLSKGFYPVADDAGALRAALVPAYMGQTDWNATDGWGRDWRYRVTDDGRGYTLVSAGSDGEFESLAPLIPGPVDSAARDLVLANNSFQRWPAGTGGVRDEPSRAQARRERGASGETPAAPGGADSPAKAEATLGLFKPLVSALESYRKQHGAYPEYDDCTRLVEVMGARAACTDAWGHSIGYLTVASGRSYVLVSPGANGAFETPLEQYVRGAKPKAGPGADLVLLQGRRVE